MARMMSGTAKSCQPCGPRCLFMGLVAAALAAAGLWVIVEGVLKQMNPQMPWTTIVLWYFGGFLLWCIAKICKMQCKACSGR